MISNVKDSHDTDMVMSLGPVLQMKTLGYSLEKYISSHICDVLFFFFLD